MFNKYNKFNKMNKLIKTNKFNKLWNQIMMNKNINYMYNYFVKKILHKWNLILIDINIKIIKKDLMFRYIIIILHNNIVNIYYKNKWINVLYVCRI